MGPAKLLEMFSFGSVQYISPWSEINLINICFTLISRMIIFPVNKFYSLFGKRGYKIAYTCLEIKPRGLHKQYSFSQRFLEKSIPSASFGVDSELFGPWVPYLLSSSTLCILLEVGQVAIYIKCNIPKITNLCISLASSKWGKLKEVL